MNSESLLILDSVLRNSLLIFLAGFVFLSSYALYRLRRKKRQLADFFEGMPGEGVPEEEHYDLQPNRLKAVFHALLLALSVAVLGFLFLGFAPVPFIHNFASTSAWQKSPLRLTQLKLDRFYEGFELEGEVWNQTQEPIEKLQVVAIIWDHERNPLERLIQEVQPAPLGSGRPGTFTFRYTENSPFLAGYELEFLDGEGNLIPHIEGFNVR